MYTHTQGRFRIMFLCKVALGATWRVEEAELDTEHIAHNLAAFGRGGPVHSVHGLTVEEVVELYITAIYIYIYIYIYYLYIGRGAQLRGVGRLRQRGGDPVLPDRVQAQLGGGLYYRPLLLRGMKAEGSCARQA